ncbi:MAG: hypothetical protein U0326_42700 [Polyangiales bacterium]
MVDDASSPTLLPVQPESTHLRTAWHPLLILLLEHLLPPELWRVEAEYPLTREPRRIDAVIVRRVADTRGWHPEYLHSVLDELREHNIVHFKGATDELERVDALQLLSYAYQYMALAGVEDPSALSLRVVAPTLTQRFATQLAVLGGVCTESSLRGVYVGTLGGFSLRVVETSVAWPQPHEHLLYAVSPACVERPGRVGGFDDREMELYYRLMQGIAKLASDPKWKAIMKDAALVESSTRKALVDLIAELPLELRLAALKPEERLVGLKPEDVFLRFKPEERLAGLKPEEQVLALSDEVLATLPESFIATLSEHAQAAIRTRVASHR